MAPSARTPEDYIASFPNPVLLAIQGEPTYEQLAVVKSQLAENAASVSSSRGGGGHGYLGLIMTPAGYLTLTGHAFVLPNQVETVVTIDGINPTQAQIQEQVRQHAEMLREWMEYNNLELALKIQQTKAIEPLYLSAIRDRVVGFRNQTPRQIIDYLFDNYGQITPQQLKANHDDFTKAWDPSTPFESIINQIEDTVEYAAQGQAPFTEEQVLNNAYNLIFQTGMFERDCLDWVRKRADDKTWATLKTHFLAAYRHSRDLRRTAQHAGYQQANMALFQQNEEFHQDTQDALANLAVSNTADRTHMTTMQEQVRNLTQQLEATQKLLASIKTTQTSSPAPTHITTRDTSAPRATRAKWTPSDRGGYCWSCGYLVCPEKHKSSHCNRKKPGHQDAASRADNIGGSEKGKPTS